MLLALLLHFAHGVDLWLPCPFSASEVTYHETFPPFHFLPVCAWVPAPCGPS